MVGSLGWSPDGSLLAMKDGPDTRFPHTSMVNGSQSWKPDGRSLLVYDGQGPSFSVRHVDGTAPTVLGAPPGADRPFGWAGSRVVWLAGAAGTSDSSSRTRRLSTPRRGCASTSARLPS